MNDWEIITVILFTFPGKGLLDCDKFFRMKIMVLIVGTVC
jgi:hypothetical protein